MGHLFLVYKEPRGGGDLLNFFFRFSANFVITVENASQSIATQYQAQNGYQMSNAPIAASHQMPTEPMNMGQQQQFLNFSMNQQHTHMTPFQAQQIQYCLQNNIPIMDMGSSEHAGFSNNLSYNSSQPSTIGQKTYDPSENTLQFFSLPTVSTPNNASGFGNPNIHGFSSSSNQSGNSDILNISDITGNAVNQSYLGNTDNINYLGNIENVDSSDNFDYLGPNSNSVNSENAWSSQNSANTDISRNSNNTSNSFGTSTIENARNQEDIGALTTSNTEPAGSSSFPDRTPINKIKVENAVNQGDATSSSFSSQVLKKPKNPTFLKSFTEKAPQKFQMNTSGDTLSLESQKILDQKPIKIQIYIKVTALFQALVSGSAMVTKVPEIVEKFASIVMSIDPKDFNPAEGKDGFSTAFSIANKLAPPTFWPYLRSDPLLMARLRNWLVYTVRQKLYKELESPLYSLQLIGLDMDQLVKFKYVNLLKHLKQKGKSEIQAYSDRILTKARESATLSSGQGSKRGPSTESVASEPKIRKISKPTSALSNQKPVTKRISVPLSSATKPGSSVSSTTSTSTPSASSNQPIKKSPAIPSTVTNSFFKFKPGPKSTTPSSSTSATPVRSMLFSDHMKSIRESSKKEVEDKKASVEKNSSLESKKKDKKKVKWRIDDELTEVREYYLDPEERMGKRISSGAIVRKNDGYKEDLVEHLYETEWYKPRDIDYGTLDIPSDILMHYPLKRGGTKTPNSEEADKQKKRESHTLIELSTSDTPKEPDEELEDQVSAKEIPVAPSWSREVIYQNFIQSGNLDSFVSASPSPSSTISIQDIAAKLSLLVGKAAQPVQPPSQQPLAPTSNQAYQPVSQPQPINNNIVQGLTPELMAQIQTLTNTFNTGNNNSVASFSTPTSNQAPSSTPVNNVKKTKHSSISQHILDMRSQDVRQKVVSDTTTLDKYRIPCKYFSSGTCQFGDGCTYIHMRK